MCVDTPNNIGYNESVNDYSAWMPLCINTEEGTGNPQNTTVGNSYSALNLSGTPSLLNNVNTNDLAVESG